MRLSDYILANSQTILDQWEKFTATLLPAAGNQGSSDLQHYAKPVLDAIAADLKTPQTPARQAEKSRSLPPPGDANAPQTAAQAHAILRARGGFNINQLVAEFRALRASVLRLWMDEVPLYHTTLEDLVRFNEAIDQAIAESIKLFDHTVERHRNLLLGMLGHDMRNPLNAILMTAQHLALLNAGQEISEAAATLIRSGSSMKALLDDLTDFNRCNLGLGLGVSPADIDLAAAADEELHQFRALYPNRPFDVTITGDTRGNWDKARVQQMLRNLVSNALKYGAPNHPIHIAIHGNQPDIRLEVTNTGQIAPADIHRLFDPLKRGSGVRDANETREGLGLGLFIVREIARAHGGQVDASSQDDRTTFAVHLPRHKNPAERNVSAQNA